MIENYKSNPQKDQKDSIICHPLGHRFVKSLVIDYQTFRSIPEYEELIEKLYELVQTELAVLIQTKAIFVIIAFIENTDYKEQVSYISLIIPAYPRNKEPEAFAETRRCGHEYS